jgi:pSer/pThr/pTyr-binding forkhead associated (FHA) protein
VGSLDSSTHLPIDIPPHGLEKEIKIGRSRRNDVVLLRDPEVSKRHCRIWRDERGDVYIQVSPSPSKPTSEKTAEYWLHTSQDLASTNGTKLKKEYTHTEERLRPHGEGADLRQYSEPKKLELGDKVILGLTTLCLRDGPAAIIEAVRRRSGAPARKLACLRIRARP